MEDKDLSIIEHLEELRKRILNVIIYYLISVFISYVFKEKILSYFIKPLVKFQEKPIFTRPVEPFFAVLKVCFLTGGILTIPYFLYQTYKFLEPGLLKKEKKIIKTIFIFFPFLFFVGMCFAYFIIIPLGLKILFSFANNTLQPFITISNYLGFTFILLLIMGFVFNLPVFIASLASIGIIKTRLLNEKRKYAYVGVFIVSAIITPTTDIFTQILVAIPLIILYEISVLLSKIFGK